MATNSCNSPFEEKFLEFSIPLTDLEIVCVVRKAEKKIDFPFAVYLARLVKLGLYDRVQTGKQSYDADFSFEDHMNGCMDGTRKGEIADQLKNLGIEWDVDAFLLFLEEKVFDFMVKKGVETK